MQNFQKRPSSRPTIITDGVEKAVSKITLMSSGPIRSDFVRDVMFLLDNPAKREHLLLSASSVSLTWAWTQTGRYKENVSEPGVHEGNETKKTRTIKHAHTSSHSRQTSDLGFKRGDLMNKNTKKSFYYMGEMCIPETLIPHPPRGKATYLWVRVHVLRGGTLPTRPCEGNQGNEGKSHMNATHERADISEDITPWVINTCNSVCTSCLMLGKRPGALHAKTRQKNLLKVPNIRNET